MSFQLNGIGPFSFTGLVITLMLKFEGMVFLFDIQNNVGLLESIISHLTVFLGWLKSVW